MGPLRTFPEPLGIGGPRLRRYFVLLTRHLCDDGHPTRA
jgi:hypothetical protein